MSISKKRPYHSDSRAAQALNTKIRIIDSCKKLFSKHGIDQVTIDDVAKDAKVSTPTVYALFQSKAGLLKALTERSLFSDSFLKLIEEVKLLADPVEVLKMTASIACSIYENEKREMGLIRGSSYFSSDLKKIEDEFESLRFSMQEERCKLLIQGGAVKKDLDLETLRDIMWMYTGRDIYRSLVIEKGWSVMKFEKWLATTLIETLLK